jgi:WD40 repeat protein
MPSKVKSLTFSRNSQQLAAAGYRGVPAVGKPNPGGVVRVWGVREGAEVAALEDPKTLLALAFTPDGKRLILGVGERGVGTWEVEGAKQVRLLAGVDGVFAFGGVVSPDGRWVAGGGLETSRPGSFALVVWDVPAGRQAFVLLRDQAGVTDLAFTPDSRRLVSAQSDGALRVWELERGQELLTLRGHEQEVGYLAVSPDGLRLASGDDGGTVKLWDAVPLTTEEARALGRLVRPEAGP